MKHIQRKTERRIAAALRLALVAVLLLLQIALVIALTQVLRQKMYIGYSVLEIIAVLCVVRIYMRSGSSTYKPGWIVLIMLVPVVGLILYFLWNGNQVKKKLDLKPIPMPPETEEVKRRSQSAQENLSARWPRWGRLAAYLRRQDMPLFENTDMTYFPTGEEYLEDLLERMKTARRFIFLEYYIASEGEIWDRICTVLTERAAAGVEVNLILDDFGSMMTMPPEEISALRKRGVWVQMFNPVHRYVNRLYFNYRDHRKIAVIDGDIAYTGGANLADEYANLIVRFGYWKDNALRLRGEATWSLTVFFLTMWDHQNPHSDFRLFRPRQLPPLETTGGIVIPYADTPNADDTIGADLYLQMISKAKRYLYLTTPYLAIDETITSALCIAARTGVDVRIMTPHIPDKKGVFAVTQSNYPVLLEAGARIFEFTPGFVHTKTMVADDLYASVGSCNLDYRSFYLQFENGVWLCGDPAVLSVRDDFLQTMEVCQEITLDDCRTLSFPRRIVQTVYRLFAPLF